MATNSPLSVVEAQIGHVRIYRRESKDWDDFRAATARYRDQKSERLLRKIDNSASVGFTSTISMQTYVFFDKRDKLIDFHVDSQ
jgi:hypothetical protein